MINNYYINNIDISFLKDSYFEYIFIYFIHFYITKKINISKS